MNKFTKNFQTNLTFDVNFYQIVCYNNNLNENYRFLPFSGKFEIYKGDGCGRQKEKIGRLRGYLELQQADRFQKQIKIFLYI